MATTPIHAASPFKVKGQIQVIFGPMFSGKSTELLRRVRRFRVTRHECLLIKYARDTRYSESGLATHDQYEMAAVPASCLYDIHSLALPCSVIGIDEGQFFPDCVQFCEEMANLGKTVIVAALDGTFQRKAFGDVLALVPLAESVVKLSAVCMRCYKEAAYTKRLGSETQVEVIGGADKYMSLCRLCYFHSEQEALLSELPAENETPLGATAQAALSSRIPARQLFPLQPHNS
ncbi:thymidine kinase, cytosolic [Lethenteron reissneri]|uniref:thymidine kinase, cytosolic n=1 Tax=Lethenteron reissneri TaxID=7753 RepID=UPI002AB6F880|nr:thymidine kinase, cytosolic [Lethenteron reissneri]